MSIHGGKGLTLYHETKFFDFTKSKIFAADKLNVAKTVISVFDKAVNIVGKGENAGYHHVLNASWSGFVKSRDCVV